MPQYTPYLISDFKTGKDIGKEPWLTPPDAFPTLLNARITQGKLQKRGGLDQVATTGASQPIMGIHGAPYKGHESIIVLDAKRAYKLDLTAETLTDLSGSDTYTGSDKQFFWFQDWRDTLIWVNATDPIHTYSESTGSVTALDTGDVTLDTCQMIFRFKNRLIFVGPVIDSVWYPHRLYYSDVNTTSISSTSYVDAETGDRPVCGGYIDNEPVVFMKNGIWRIRYTRDSDAPFTWVQQRGDGGSLTPRMCVPIGAGLATLYKRDLIFYDGSEPRVIDPKVLHVADSMDAQNLWYCQGVNLKSRFSALFAYPTSTYNDRILEYNHGEGSWSEHSIAAHCLYAFDGEVGPAGDVLDDALGDDGDAAPAISDLDIVRHTSGALTLVGDRTGGVYLMDSGTDDNGSDIAVDIRTSRLNPYTQEGRQARLGRVRFLATSSATASYTVGLYKDQATTAFKSQTLSFSGNGDKHWETINGDGEVGRFFRIHLSHTDSANAPEIHAIMLDFSRGPKL